MEHFNQGRPFILAGFSQGADAIDGDNETDARYCLPADGSCLFHRLQAGFRDVDSVDNIRLAEGATDTGVTIAFNSLRSPECMLFFSEGTAACINPVNWRTDSVSCTFVYYGRRRNDTLSVRCDPESRHLIVGGYTKTDPCRLSGYSRQLSSYGVEILLSLYPTEHG